MFQRIIIGLIGMAASYLVIKYRKNIYDFVGTVDFAEHYLGRGGTFTLLVILAIAIFVLSLMYMTGTLQVLVYEKVGSFMGE